MVGTLQGGMRIRIIKWVGGQAEGIVLSTFGSMIRVAIPGCDDAVEFSNRGGYWFSEEGEPVEIEFPASEARTGDMVSDGWTDLNSRGTQAVVRVN